MEYNSKGVLNSLFRTRNLLLTPKREWERIAPESSTTKELFRNFAFPVIAICAIIAAGGTYIHTKEVWVSVAKFFVDFLALNLGLFCAAKLIVLLSPNFQLSIKAEVVFKLVIYSASVFCIFHGIAQLFSPFSFLNQICLLLELYFIRILWLGTSSILPIANNKRPGFTVMASLLILVLPLIFERLFSILFRFPLTI
ncbi:hypothetical protein [Marinifilum caeruleilacunae]|uniref:Yip1 domain-containing protein n=1 Tax=Marinifilum caeruleilacunae TaxID=2499076 RepID=A0ABX1WYN5_9BACT|nr:hypothetical protein [Marinifilum caeruleilacunae]NOU61036.1 hypothetical protein [Marinifilum caeruleilacunae]